ncbi:unnamed protein product [Cercospora beticola]|nr:unnamed protein product [Cercospora beticola]
MGNVCSFDSPDLVKAVLVGAAGAAVPVIPTFAIAAANAAFLSVTGSFTYDSGSFQPSGSPCLIPTAISTVVDGTVQATTLAVTPYISGPAGRTNCALLTPTAVDDIPGSSTYTVLSCPSVILSALPTGQHVLGFDFDAGDPEFAMNTFMIGLPPQTTTLDPEPGTTVTKSEIVATVTTTTTLEPVPATTTTITIPTATTTLTSTEKIQTIKTTTKTVYTKTITATTVIVGRPYGTSTSTKYTGTATKKTTSTVTSTTTVCKNSYNKRGIVAARDGGNPDFTYPPEPTTSTVTPPADPDFTRFETKYVTATETSTETPPARGTSTVTSYVELTETTTIKTTELSTTTSTLKTGKTVTTTSTSRKKGECTTLYLKKTVYVTVTKTAKATVTRKNCKPKGC